MSVLDESGKCRCGFDEDAPTDEDAIPVRSVVGEKYIIGRMFKKVGEGIVYIALDKENEEKVYIEEYMPSKMAKRSDLTGEVLPLSGFETQYKTHKADFYDLFDALRNFRHTENMMPVINVFCDNNTVYAVYKYIKTISYGDYLSHNGGEFTWPQVKKLFMPLFTTLTYLHSNGFVHRGITPETIRVNAKGQLMLWGFGTASLRSKGSDIEQEIAPGYSAPEQYVSGSWHGEWTDVYSVAAVLYKSLTGTLPVEADSRREDDHLCAPENLNINIASNVSDAIMNAMTVSSEYRTRSIDDLTAELLESSSSNTKLFGMAEEAEIKKAEEEYFPEEAPKKRKKKEKEKRRIRIPWGLVATFIAMVILLGIVMFLFRFTEILGFGNRPSNDSSSGNVSVSEPISESDYLHAVPNFVGRMRADVEGNAQYDEFVLVFEEDNNNEYAAGMIYDQDIKYRTEVEEGTTITLKVSLGPEKVAMPSLVGVSIGEAERILTELGINYTTMGNSNYEQDIVFDQSVAPETEVTVNDRVNKVWIYYGTKDENDEGSTSIWGSSGSDDEDDDVVIIDGRN